MHERAAQVRAGGEIDDEVVGGIVALLPESAQHPSQQAGQFAPLRLVGVDERGPVFFRNDPDFARMLGGERGDREEMRRILDDAHSELALNGEFVASRAAAGLVEIALLCVPKTSSV